MCAFYATHLSYAENQIQTQEEDITIELSPEIPNPYEDVTISLVSYATDLNKAIITWQSGGETVLSGIGRTSYTLKAKGPDTLTVVNISIVPVGSVSTITKKVTIRPQEVEIMWESVDGYTPPFYKGKSLPITGGTIRVIAIPNTNTIKSGSGSFSYEWKNNNEVNLASSGYNKNFYTFKNSYFDTENKISVVASSVKGDFTGKSTIKIPLFKPRIVFYEKSASLGILYNKALEKEVEISENEMTFVAEPYNLPNIYSNSVNYSWKINNDLIQTPSKKNELTVRPTSRGGYANISLTIENLKELFQKVNNQLKLNL